MKQKLAPGDKIKLKSATLSGVPAGTVGFITKVVTEETENLWAMVEAVFPGKGISTVYGNQFKVSGKVRAPRKLIVKGKNLRLGDTAEWYGINIKYEIVKLEWDRVEDGDRELINVYLLDDRENIVKTQVDPGEKLEVLR